MDNGRAAFSESEKLSGSTNYSDWSVRAKLLLQDRECWDEIIVNPPAPPPALTDAKKLELKKKKIKAMALLSQVVTSPIISTVRKFEGNPKGLWDHLKARYESKGTQRKPCLLYTSPSPRD